MRVQALGAAAVLTLTSLSAPAAEPGETPKYVGAQAFYSFTDSARNADFAAGGRFYGGVPLTDRLSFELGAFGYRTRRETGTGRDPGLGAGGDFAWRFGTGTVRPFLLAGAGYLVEQIQGVRDGGAYANLGGGVLVRLADDIDLRGELRYLGVFNDVAAPGQDPLYDLHLGVGLEFGVRATSAPAPAPAARVQPEPRPADTDADGVRDSVDRCPGTAKDLRVDAFGCPRDTDNDGVLDSVDRCPGTRRGALVDSAGCSTDEDGDGVAGPADRCPGTPQGVAVDAKGCPRDSDRDGIADHQDRCPDTAAGLRVGADGCVRDAQTLVLQNVAFKFDSHNLTAESERFLQELAVSLRGQPDLRIEIAGHSDSVGNDRYNLQLSQRRADSVRLYLISQGIDGEKLIARGYGESQPVADNATKEGQAKNRRVELRVLR